MSGDMKVEFSSWNRAARGFDEVSKSAPTSLSGVVSATTNPGACGADGPSTVDGAVSLMLTAFAAVMQEGFITPLQEGLASEANALVDTGKQLQDMEDDNTTTAQGVGEGY